MGEILVKIIACLCVIYFMAITYRKEYRDRWIITLVCGILIIVCVVFSLLT